MSPSLPISMATSKKDEASQPLLKTIAISGPPQVSKLPQLSDAPKTTEISRVSHVLQAVSVPEISKASFVPDISKITQVIQTVSIPEIPKVPLVPEVPTVSQILQAALIPEVPKVPQTFQAPQTSQIQGALKVPQVLQASQIPQIPEIPQLPQFPDVISSSTPLLGASNIPKDSIISFLKLLFTKVLLSRQQHKAVISLVILDLVRSFIGICLNFLTNHTGGALGHISFLFDGIRSLLASLGFLISNVFILELVTSVWTFGWRYFKSPFHVLDAFAVIFTVTSSLLPNTLNEFASLMVVLRLWRLFKHVGGIISSISPVSLLPSSYV